MEKMLASWLLVAVLMAFVKAKYEKLVYSNQFVLSLLQTNLRLSLLTFAIK